MTNQQPQPQVHVITCAGGQAGYVSLADAIHESTEEANCLFEAIHRADLISVQTQTIAYEDKEGYHVFTHMITITYYGLSLMDILDSL